MTTRPLAALVALAALLAAPAAAPAEPPKLADSSLALVPAKASFYNASLRNREQLDAFLKSNALAKIRALPFVKTGLDSLHGADSPVAPLVHFFHAAENRELVAVLAEMASDEVFLAGGSDFGSFVQLMVSLNGAIQGGRLQALFAGQFQPAEVNKVAAQAMLKALADDADKIVAPDLVIGFRVATPAAALAQLDKLETLLRKQTDGVPALKGRLTRGKLGGGDYLTLTLEGKQVPWDDLPLRGLEPEKGDFDKLIARLKKLTLAVSVGVRGPYVLVASGPDTKALAGLGQGELLRDRAELKPVLARADGRVASVGYVSADLAKLTATTGEDVDGMIGTVRDWLDDLNIPLKQRKRIDKDILELAGDWKATLAVPGASSGVSLLTPRGVETLAFDFAPRKGPAPAELTVLDHLGGSPVLAVAGVGPIDMSTYRRIVHWTGVLAGYADEFLPDRLGEDGAERYRAAMKALRPLAKRFDEITGTMLLPSFGDQAAFVLDARLTGKDWLPGRTTDKPLAVPEPAYIRTVRDAELLLKAFRSYHTLANDTIEAARKQDTQGVIPEGFTLPALPQTKGKGGTLIGFPLPEGLTDGRIRPTLGVSPRLFTATLSPGHAERLLAPTPLTATGPLAAKRPLVSASVFDFGRFLDAFAPWLDEVILPAALGDRADEDEGKDIAKQARTVLAVLRGFRGATTAVYTEGGATVTHTEAVFEDVR
jgi:hypothetical protein